MVLNRELVRGSMEVMILSTLADGELYGYLIQKRIREISGNQIRPQVGTLYRMLNRLEGLGAVKARWDKSGIRSRKWYQLTAKGRGMLEQQAADWRRSMEGILQLLKPALPGVSLDSAPA